MVGFDCPQPHTKFLCSQFLGSEDFYFILLFFLSYTFGSEAFEEILFIQPLWVKYLKYYQRADGFEAEVKQNICR